MMQVSHLCIWDIWMKTCPFVCLPHVAQMPQKRILMVSSRSSRSHSMLRRLFLSSLVVQSISSLVAVDGSWRSSVHLWNNPCAVLTAFWTSLEPGEGKGQKWDNTYYEQVNTRLMLAITIRPHPQQWTTIPQSVSKLLQRLFMDKYQNSKF